ncbi:MAG TPA: DinB family protein [Candidatus Sulfomarinibacteraceae bacterium]|nr:DinB family protein [Candidatus Sulfomarinibacteraceae bacterium]
MRALDAQAARLEAAVAAILALRARVEAAAPWPLAGLYGTEAEASWGPPELLAHLDEMLPFWLGEAERIIDGPAGDPVPFGRVPGDTIRIGVIGRDRTVPLRELFARLEADGARVARRMRELTDEEAARVGTNPARGEFTVAGLFERLVTGHLEDHVAQLQGILADRGV